MIYDFPLDRKQKLEIRDNGKNSLHFFGLFFSMNNRTEFLIN
jgi:hypothetical protein